MPGSGILVFQESNKVAKYRIVVIATPMRRKTETAWTRPITDFETRNAREARPQTCFENEAYAESGGDQTSHIFLAYIVGNQLRLPTERCKLGNKDISQFRARIMIAYEESFVFQVSPMDDAPFSERM